MYAPNNVAVFQRCGDAFGELNNGFDLTRILLFGDNIEDFVAPSFKLDWDATEVEAPEVEDPSDASDVIDPSSLPEGSNPYSSPLDRIWEIEFKD